MRHISRLGLGVGMLLAVGIAVRIMGPQPQPPTPSREMAYQPPQIEERFDLIYGRVTTIRGAVYQGRLRWGGDEEALWGNYFNGAKKGNLYATLVAEDSLPNESVPIELLGMEFGRLEVQRNLERPFMVRFGDIARIEASGVEIRVILKSGSEYVLDRFSADDLADGLHIWDDEQGPVQLGEWRIRSVEFLPASSASSNSYPLYGTVHTRNGIFTGLVQWNRKQTMGSDVIEVATNAGAVDLRFDSIRSIVRGSSGEGLIALTGDMELALTGEPGMTSGGRGTYVDDPRYGRVLVSHDALERIDFQRGDGPSYEDFSPSRRLSGTVSTRAGLQLTGSLVFDLDESDTAETLDAPAEGVDYTIPFGLIASIHVPHGLPYAQVLLRSGEELRLERASDLGDGNAGMLVLSEGQPPAYIPWGDVETIDLESGG